MSSFYERQKSLFNHLKNAEDQYSFSKFNKATTPQDYGVIDHRTYRKVKHEMKQFRGKESIFKRPEDNIRNCLRAKTVPDYLKNPQKWTYYSLSDVTPEQMSDATNTATALALMKELEEREAAKTKMEQDSKDSDDVVFKKPTFHISATVKKIPEIKEKKVFKGNKIVMPEYVVGVSQKKEKKSTMIRKIDKECSNAEKKVELKLNHLYDEE